MHLATMSIDELLTKLDSTHELNRDAMLEKIVLLTVATFCVSTELRFIAMSDDHKKDPNNPAVAPPLIEPTTLGLKLASHIDFKRKLAEFWHIKAVRMGCTFLPADSPLVTHCVNNFIKHHK
jgi:hypothetical protein